MTDQAARWHRVEQLCAAALERAGGDRTAFLRDACGDDEALRHEVEQLLAQESQADGFLHGSVATVAAAVMSSTAPSLTGHRLNALEVGALIGAGGMGEVYRARDTELKREVALKVLPASLAGDAERLARFRREAEVLASLNHPNIASIYGLEQGSGVVALVMELVEGDDLSARIARGAMPIDDVLPIAKQIAEALEAAHEHGIIHRDLKPANIKVRADGVVKVLDFGLAKALEPTSAVRPGTLTNSPTVTSPALMTGVGVLLGTAAYMSPEQARGLIVDRRADVWSFGVVLWEMLTGVRLFEGATVSDTIASVLKTEPDWKVLPHSTHPAIRRLLRRCLEKDRKRRLDSASDARLEIDEASSTPLADADSRGTSVARVARLPWLVASAALLVAAALALPAIGFIRKVSPARETLQLTMPAPENTQFGGPEGAGTGTETQLAISPDGRQVVFVARAESGYQLWLRPMNAATARPIPGTEEAAFPFWSPDNRFVGFFAGGKLKRVALDGGPSVSLCDVRLGRGGSWNRDNIIIFGSATNDVGIQRVPAGGGVPVLATAVDTTYGESSHRWPSFLPDGRHFLYTAVVGTFQTPKPGRVKVGELDAPDTSTLFEVESSVAYASGHLLSNRLGTLVAQPFDPLTRQLTGESALVAKNVGLEGSRYASFSVSDTGVLLYGPQLNASDRQLTWMDRVGRTLGTVGPVRTYVGPSVARGGDRSIAVRIFSGGPQINDLWVLNGEGTQRRLTIGAGGTGAPVWSPDGKRVAFQGTRDGAAALFVSGSGEEELLLNIKSGVVPTDWSADGQFITYQRSGANGSSDIWVLALSGDHKNFPFAQTAASEAYATFAPNGHWMAYQASAENARSEVYVRSFPPGTGQPYQISVNGGSIPRWRADGKELFFIAPNGTMMAVDIDITRRPKAGAPQPLFRSPGLNSINGRPYDVSPNGDRFLVSLPAAEAAPSAITVVVNWLAILQK